MQSGSTSQRIAVIGATGRVGSPLVEVLAQRGTTCARMIPASERLYRAVIEQRITHANDPDLNRHIASAVAKEGPRGWRLGKAQRSAQVDRVVALAMALERAESRPASVALLGWV